MKCQNTETRRLVRMPGFTYPSTRRRYSYLQKNARRDSRGMGDGFTALELLIVVVIIAIAALTTVPMMSSAGSLQIRSAANMIAADLEYAKSMAISRGQNFSVVFYPNTESYEVKDQSGSVILHPVKKGFPYTINFQNDSRLNKVNITGADFGANPSVRFDCLGSPDNGGTISLLAGGTSVTVRVEPVTGYISIE